MYNLKTKMLLLTISDKKLSIILTMSCVDILSIFNTILLFTLVTAQPNTHDLDLTSVVKNLQDELHRLKIQVENLEESHKTCVSSLKSLGM